MKDMMNMTPLPYVIKSIPLKDGSGYEFELYAYTEKALGEKKSESIDLIYQDESHHHLEGFILIIERVSGLSSEIGTPDSPLPVELIEQMRHHRGLAFYEINEQRQVHAFYTLHL